MYQLITKGDCVCPHNIYFWFLTETYEEAEELTQKVYREVMSASEEKSTRLDRLMHYYLESRQPEDISLSSCYDKLYRANKRNKTLLNIKVYWEGQYYDSRVTTLDHLITKVKKSKLGEIELKELT